MEKFGIFELLDTLSALTAGTGEDKAAPKDEAPAPPQQSAQPPARGSAGSDALQGFLARHDAVARKADGKRP